MICEYNRVLLFINKNTYINIHNYDMKNQEIKKNSEQYI